MFDGHLLSNRGIDTWHEKIKAVKESLEPENVSETRSFLRLVNFFGRLKPNLATAAEPLRKLITFEFGAEQREAFDKLERYLAEAEMLDYFTVKVRGCATSNTRWGTTSHYVCKSKPVSSARRYWQTEREALALVWTSDKYVHGLDFDLVADHKPL